MSVRVLSWVLDHSPVENAVERLVLIALADHAHDDGTGAYPSVNKLCRKTKRDRSTVQRALGRLQDQGAISEQYVRGDGVRVWAVITGGPADDEAFFRLPQSGEPQSAAPPGPQSAAPAVERGPNRPLEPSIPSQLSLERTVRDGSGRRARPPRREDRELWEDVQTWIAGRVTDVTFAHWLKPLQLIGFFPGGLVLEAPDEIRGMVAERYLAAIAAGASELAGRPITVDVVGPGLELENEDAPRPAGELGPRSAPGNVDRPPDEERAA